MSDNNQRPLDSRAELERRFYAAVIDMVIVAVGSFAVMQAGSAVVPVEIPRVRNPAVVLIVVILFVEAISGRSIGKLVRGLSVGGRAGGRATVTQKVSRAFLRWFAPLVALASVLPRNVGIAGMLLGTSIIIVICELPACYITYFRRDGTVFDLLTHTRVMHL